MLAKKSVVLSVLKGAYLDSWFVAVDLYVDLEFINNVSSYHGGVARWNHISDTLMWPTVTSLF